MKSDSFEFVYQHDAMGQLPAALLMAMDDDKITHYGFDGSMLRLFWSAPSGVATAQPLPYPMAGQAIIDFVRHWLTTAMATLKITGTEPDTDGTAAPGYKITSDRHDGWSYESCRIEAVWMIYGK
jgi:hypothetical protein